MSDIQDTIHCITDEPSTADPEIAIPQKVNSLIRELDELASMALGHDTKEIVAREERSIGMILTRAVLVLSLVEAVNPPLRVVGGLR